MPDPNTLVEHTFRHEYGRLVALLTRQWGIQSIDLIEDVVQAAMIKAMHSWGLQGPPDNPSAWLYRTAKNLAIDQFRRHQREHRNLDADLDSVPSEPINEGFDFQEVGDEPLRLLFLCCHPSVSLESRIAFALKTVSGFSTSEVAEALMISHANAEKRIGRAKESLRQQGVQLVDLGLSELRDRLASVEATIYLLFNEGYYSTSAPNILRQDLCTEAIRLARMLQQLPFPSASSQALLGLLLLHSARMTSRQSDTDIPTLLEDQDRSRWDWGKIRQAMEAMQASTQDEQLSRYHVEAAIAWEHCRAATFHDIDWPKITDYYRVLFELYPGPMVALNWAIAESYSLGSSQGLQRLIEFTPEQRSRIRPWWDCAVADIYLRQGQIPQAIHHWQDALQLCQQDVQRKVIQQKIQKVDPSYLS